MSKNKKTFKSGAKTEAQNTFAKLVAKGVEVKEAYIRAGYSENVAHREAQRLCRKPGVKEAISYYEAYYKKPLDLTGKGMMTRLKLLADFNIKDLIDENGDFMSPEKIPHHVAYSISDYKKKEIVDKDRNVCGVIHEYKFFDKKWALEKLKEYKSSLIEENVKSDIESSSPEVRIKLNGFEIPKIFLKKLKEEKQEENNEDD